MENREVINDVLVHLFNEIMELEEQAIITEEYKDITNNDMHIIEAVGLGGNKMSDIAAKLNITVGSLTTSMNSLVKKGYATRAGSPCGIYPSHPEREKGISSPCGISPQNDRCSA